MRYIRRQTTNNRGLVGKGVHYTINEEVLLDSVNSVLIPKGNTAERPTYPTEGHLRYNTQINEFESYQNGAWRSLRFKEPNQNPGIRVQELGIGDDIETKFGVLNSGDPDFPVPAAAQNILVFVENVFQLPHSNYSLEQNPSGYSAGWYVVFNEAVPTGKPVTVIHNFDK